MFRLFTSVDLAGANIVVVHVGREQKVVVHADDNLLGRVTTHRHRVDHRKLRSVVPRARPRSFP
jgi:hypothetical protein